MASTRRVEVPFGDVPSDTAVLLLAAAESLNMDQSVVKTGGGVFIVPTEVADEAGFGEQEKQEPKRRPATKKSAKKK